MVKNLSAMQEIWVRSLGWEDPWRREWQPTPVFFPGQFHGLRSLAGHNPWCCKESDMTEQLTHIHSLREIEREQESMNWKEKRDLVEKTCNQSVVMSSNLPCSKGRSSCQMPSQTSLQERSPEQTERVWPNSPQEPGTQGCCCQLCTKAERRAKLNPRS